jgi:hypothetical protein
MVRVARERGASTAWDKGAQTHVLHFQMKKEKTMRTLLMIAVSLAVLCMPTLAQEYPRAEAYGGYQFFHHVDPSFSANGWNAAVTGNITRWFGVKADFSGSYRGGEGLYTYMVGPVVTLRTKRVSPFVHALFGGASLAGNGSFASAVGGGLDLNASEHIAWRLVQADWLFLRRGGETDRGGGRISTGIVFRF